MAITKHKDGGFTITGQHIRGFQIIALRSALKFEVKTGMKATRGANPARMVKEMFGFKGNKEKLLDQLNAWMQENMGI